MGITTQINRAHNVINKASFPIAAGFRKSGTRKHRMRVVYASLRRLGRRPYTTQTIHEHATEAITNLPYLACLGALVDLEALGLVTPCGTTWSPDTCAKHLRHQHYQRIWRIK